MYICSNGHVFDQPAEEPEYMGYGIWETFGYCPECGSDDFVEATRCRKCGDWVNPDDITNGMCPTCRGLFEDEDNEQ